MGERFRELSLLVYHAARTVAGRRFWLYPLIPLVWPLIQFIWVYMQWRETDFDIPDAQNFLIGLPLAVLASLLGIRIIAGEIDRRTLEIAFTVPGGAHRIWLAKITAAIGMIVLAEALWRWRPGCCSPTTRSPRSTGRFRRRSS